MPKVTGGSQWQSQASKLLVLGWPPPLTPPALVAAATCASRQARLMGFRWSLGFEILKIVHLFLMSWEKSHLGPWPPRGSQPQSKASDAAFFLWGKEMGLEGESEPGPRTSAERFPTQGGEKDPDGFPWRPPSCPPAWVSLGPRAPSAEERALPRRPG